MQPERTYRTDFLGFIRPGMKLGVRGNEVYLYESEDNPLIRHSLVESLPTDIALDSEAFSCIYQTPLLPESIAQVAPFRFADEVGVDTSNNIFIGSFTPQEAHLDQLDIDTFSPNLAQESAYQIASAAFGKISGGGQVLTLRSTTFQWLEPDYVPITGNKITVRGKIISLDKRSGTVYLETLDLYQRRVACCQVEGNIFSARLFQKFIASI